MLIPSFQERYCNARGCDADVFARTVFWRCLHRRAVPFALLHGEFFAPDRELIRQAGRARMWLELDEEIRDFMLDSRNRTWWRGRAHLRLSTHRLRAVARQYLPAAPSRRMP